MFPDVLVLVPSLNHLEPFEVKDAQILCLVVGAAQHGRYHLHELEEDFYHVHLGHSQSHNQLQEVDAVHGVGRREHQSGVDALLDKELTHLELVVDLGED